MKSARYLKKEDDLIVKTITNNPGNISECCRVLAEKLDRTPESISMRWYFLRKKTKKSFMLIGYNRHSYNSKNINITIKHKASILTQIKKLFA